MCYTRVPVGLYDACGSHIHCAADVTGIGSKSSTGCGRQIDRVELKLRVDRHITGRRGGELHQPDVRQRGDGRQRRDYRQPPAR